MDTGEIEVSIIKLSPPYDHAFLKFSDQHQKIIVDPWAPLPTGRGILSRDLGIYLDAVRTILQEEELHKIRRYNAEKFSEPLERLKKVPGNSIKYYISHTDTHGEDENFKKVLKSFQDVFSLLIEILSHSKNVPFELNLLEKQESLKKFLDLLVNSVQILIVDPKKRCTPKKCILLFSN